MAARPVVALTSTTREIGGMMRVRLNEAYVNAVVAAGLAPLVLPPLAPNDLDGIVEAVDGVVFTGGEDIDPAEYGAPASAHSAPPHQARDRCELALLRIVRERSLPTLAICRGIQLVNVGLGGTLVQDIASEYGTSIRHDQSDERKLRVHDVTIAADSNLARAVDGGSITVNSSHHQAIARVADGLRVTANAPDGIIEGVEWTRDDWWMLAVQWHPEELIDDTRAWDRGIFRAFADRVREQR